MYDAYNGVLLLTILGSVGPWPATAFDAGMTLPRHDVSCRVY